jgi:MFS family permease
MTNGLMMHLVPRLPEIKQNFGLSEGYYGLVVAAMGFGAISAGPLPARLISRFGPLRVGLVTTWTAAIFLAVAGFAGTPVLFAAAYFLVGFLDASIDAAQNTQGVQVENWTGRTIINSLHGTWSVGAIIAGGIGAACAGLGVPIRWQALGMSILIAVLALFCYRMGHIPTDVAKRLQQAKADQDRRAHPNWRRLLPAIPLALIGLAGVLPEDVTHNWGAVYLVSEFDLPFATAGLAMVVMLAMQIIGRFTADGLTERFGAWQLATVGGLLVGSGGLLMVSAPHPALVYLGLALMGYGCASLVPTAYAAAGRIPGVASGTGITVVSFAMRITFTFSSPFIGGAAELFGLRIALLVAAVAGLTAAALCWRARVRSAA